MKLGSILGLGYKSKVLTILLCMALCLSACTQSGATSMEKHEYKDSTSTFCISAPTEWSYSVEKPVLDEAGNNLYPYVGITLLPTRDDSNVIAFMRMDEGTFELEDGADSSIKLNDSLDATMLDSSTESMVMQTIVFSDAKYGIIIRMDVDFYGDNKAVIEDILESVEIK